MTTTSLEPAIDPNNRMSFLLDWEVTMKCNLDCSYCPTGIHGGHDNSTAHPKLKDCLRTIDFMFKYVDIHMSQRIPGMRYVVLNMYGGESLHHPDAIEILQEVRNRYQPYQDRWHLTITTTTNAIIHARKFDQVIPLVDEFTCSYHTENSQEDQTIFKNNLLKIKAAGRRVKCIVLMHAEPEKFAQAQDMIEWCVANGVRHLARQLDHPEDQTQFNYSAEQVVWFDRLYQQRNHNAELEVEYKQVNNAVDLADSGRACCGGRQMCSNQNYRQRTSYVVNKFPDWYCSVNQFFLYVKQVNGEIYTNRDCKMNFASEIGPIGMLGNTDALLAQAQAQVDIGYTDVIQCKKSRCLCGLCAPKAKNLDTFKQLMEKYRL